MSVREDLGLAKKLIFNRRYKTWLQWFYANVGVGVYCAYLNTEISLKLFETFAMWSTLGLIALIGGLSATDFVKIKNGSAE